MDATTAVCRQCNKRFPLRRRSNQHQRASGRPHKGTRFCGPGCKQAAYRARKSQGGTTPHATVTRPLEPIENASRIRAPKTVLDIEVWGAHDWEARESSGRVPIMVARLGKSALIRRAA